MKKETLALAAAAAALILSGGALQFAASGGLMRYKREAPEGIEYIPGPRTLRMGSFGFEKVLADWLWLRSIQYFNAESKKPRTAGAKKAPILGPISEAITDLDPNFHRAYVYSSLFLRVVRRFDEAIDLLRKGERNHPGYFYYPFEIGNVAYFDLRETPVPEGPLKEPGVITYRDAGVIYYKKALGKKDVPPFFEKFFGSVLRERGESKYILDYYAEQFKKTPSAALKEYYKTNIKSTFASMLASGVRNAVNSAKSAGGTVPGAAALPLHPSLAGMRLKPRGQVGRYAAYRTVELTHGPVVKFSDTILYDPEGGRVFSLFSIREIEALVRDSILDAVDRYKERQGRLPPEGPEGMKALREEGLLRRSYLHPLGGGYVLGENGMPRSEEGWEGRIEALESGG